MKRVSITLPDYFRTSSLSEELKSALLGNSIIAINLNGGDGDKDNTFVYQNPVREQTALLEQQDFSQVVVSNRETSYLLLNNSNKIYTLRGELINNSVSLHIEGVLITPTYTIVVDQCIDINVPNTNCEKIALNAVLDLPNNQGFIIFQYIYIESSRKLKILNIFFILVNTPLFRSFAA